MLSNYTYDTYGRHTGTLIQNTGSLTGDVVTRSLAGNVIDQTAFDGLDFVDANPTGDNYVYDTAGRLTSATIPGTTFDYSYGTASACTAPDAGDNTNRTAAVITGVGAASTASCYDHADRLESTTIIPAAHIVYDDHGNTTRLGDEHLRFDASDRHIATTTPAAVTRYLRDPLDRIAARQDTPRVEHVATTTITQGSPADAITITRPTGTQEGDLIVASISTRAYVTPTPVTASGWNVADSQTTPTSRTTVLWRHATSSDPSQWTFPITGVLTTSTGALTTYRATAGTTPIATTATSDASLASNHPLPQVTTTTDAIQLVHVTGLAGNTAATPANGTTPRANLAGTASLLVADQSQDGPGASSTAPVTTTAAVNSASITIAVTAVTTQHRLGYDSHTDNPSTTFTPADDLAHFTVPLAGGALLTWNSTDGSRFVHTNWHGDTITITNESGSRIWTGLTGPYGEQASTAMANTGMAVTTWGWHAQDQRLTDRHIVHMGARPYSPTHGRFLAVDPLEGGCANNYTYVHGDPVNTDDITGRGFWEDAWNKVKCYARELNPFDVTGANAHIIGAGGAIGHAGVLAITYTGGGAAAFMAGLPLLVLGAGIIAYGVVRVYRSC